MAILGRLDASTFANTVAVTQNSATVTKNAADEIDQGDIIELGGVPYLVKQVNTTTQITLHTEYAASDNATLAGAVRRTAPKAVAEYIIKGADSASYELVFVDATEESVSTNKSRGIWGPGWWKYRTFVDASGNTRHKAECIAALQATAAVAGDDADDTIVADEESVITIDNQPQTIGDGVTTLATPAGAAQTFVVAASSTGSSPVLTFQWQRRSGASGRWTNITATLDGSAYTGYTQSTLTVAQSALADTSLNGYEYRVKVNNSIGGKEVISDAATLNLV